MFSLPSGFVVVGAIVVGAIVVTGGAKIKLKCILWIHYTLLSFNEKFMFIVNFIFSLI